MTAQIEEIVEKSAETITADIYVGLREGYSETRHDIEELKRFMQGYVDRVSLCVTVTPTTFVYKNGKEDGARIGLINYPRFPATREKIEQIAREIAAMCMKEYKQNRVSIVLPDRTIMLEDTKKS